MKTSIIIQNLKCGGCANTITTKISALSNIKNVAVNLESSRVSFEALTTEDAITVKNKLSTLGYPSVDETNNTILKAKSMVSCATGKITQL